MAGLEPGTKGTGLGKGRMGQRAAGMEWKTAGGAGNSGDGDGNGR